MDEDRLKYAIDGLQRFGSQRAIRSAERLEIAVEHSRSREVRLTEQLSYSLRESLEEIPSPFGQERLTFSEAI